MQTPRKGGTLLYGLVGDYSSLEGQTVAVPAVDSLWSVWDRLTAYDANLKPQPMLAESWGVSSDSREFTFNLRKGVQFHTGRELTADDVKWCLQRLQDPSVGSTLTGRAMVVTAVEAPDKYTVIIRTSRPWVEVFDFLEYANIIDPLTFQVAGVTKPTGTGAFVFAEYAQGDHLRLVRNTSYWRNDRPYLDDILVSIQSDAQSAAVQLEAGSLDLLGYGLRVSDAVRLQQDPQYEILVDSNTGAFWALVANCQVSPTNNKLVRQALNYALDRKRIADTIWRGLAKAEALPWSATSPAYDATKVDAFAFDLDKARSLLTQSGLSEIHLDLVWSTGIDEWSTVAQMYQADLARVGVDLALKPMERAAAARAVLNRSYAGLLMNTGLNGHLRPATMILGPYYGPELNWAGYKDDTYTQLANRALSETDLSKQQLLADELNNYYLEQAWVAPITQNPPHLAARTTVRGLRYDAHEALVLSEVWLA